MPQTVGDAVMSVVAATTSLPDPAAKVIAVAALTFPAHAFAVPSVAVSKDSK